MVEAHNLLGKETWQYKINHAITEQVREMLTLQAGDIPTTVAEMFGFY